MTKNRHFWNLGWWILNDSYTGHRTTRIPRIRLREIAVDERNPAPVDRWFIPLFCLGFNMFQPLRLVQDFAGPSTVCLRNPIPLLPAGNAEWHPSERHPRTAKPSALLRSDASDAQSVQSQGSDHVGIASLGPAVQDFLEPREFLVAPKKTFQKQSASDFFLGNSWN